MGAVTIINLHKQWGSQTVLHDINLTVPDGSLTAVLGASGCGKTTLLRIIAGFIRADSGTVRIGDQLIADGQKSVRPERRGVGYVPQEGALFPHLSVGANILFGLPRAERTKARLAELLELAELPSDLVKRSPHEVSGGQQQRIAIARALAPKPSVILLDEPFSSLDTALRANAGKRVTRVLRAAGATAILVTHDQGEALSLSDQVAVMRGGRFVRIDTPAGVYRHPGDAETAQFIGGAALIKAHVLKGRAQTILGDVTVNAPDGPAELMVRPEQIQIMAESSGSAVSGFITEATFLGAQTLVTVDLGTRSVTARCSSISMPEVGDRVGVCVDGPVERLKPTS